MNRGRTTFSVENRENRFDNMRSGWLKETKTASKFKNIKPDKLTWGILRGTCTEHGREDSNMHQIIDMIFIQGNKL
jgi:hypothetical protein